jgi:hypothetical protein
VGVTYVNGQLPLPNGAYGGAGGAGIGAIYVPGLSPVVEEWSASKSPYYTYGDPVLRKGLVYYLNYAWDGSTVGPPESQVDAYGNRVWSLKPDGDGGGITDQVYSNIALKGDKTKYWGLFACHKLFDTNYSYSGRMVTLFEHGLTKDTMPKAYYNYTDEPVRSYSVSVGANGISADFFKLIITHNTNYPYVGGTNTALGIFDSLKDFPYQTSGEGLGALYYSESISYTLTEDNWWMKPEYNETSPLPTRTFTYTDTSGATVNRTINNWMVFVPETLLGRTYSGAFRVYRKIGFPNTLIERFELDSVTPLFSTD